MRVAHIVAHPPFREGTGTSCYYNAWAAREHGVDAHVYAPDLPGKPPAAELDVPYHYMPCHFAVGNAYLTPHLPAIARPDIVHLHAPFIFGSELALALAQAHGVPLVVTYHSDLQTNLRGGGWRYPAFAGYNTTLAPLPLLAAHTIIVTSFDYAATSLYASTLFRWRQGALVAIPNGVEVDTFRPDVDTRVVCARHALHPDEVVVVFVASLDRSHIRKGLALLLDALGTLDIPGVRLLVVGDGDMRGEYEARAAQPDLAGRVQFAGRVPQPELPAYYAAADIVAIPSLPPEAFGITLAEGQAAGCAAIGSNIPGVRRVVKDGETGLLITPGSLPELVERLRTLVTNHALRERMGRQARAWMQQEYSWRAVGAQLCRVYDKVLHHG